MTWARTAALLVVLAAVVIALVLVMAGGDISYVYPSLSPSPTG